MDIQAAALHKWLSVAPRLAHPVIRHAYQRILLPAGIRCADIDFPVHALVDGIAPTPAFFGAYFDPSSVRGAVPKAVMSCQQSDPPLTILLDGSLAATVEIPAFPSLLQKPVIEALRAGELNELQLWFTGVNEAFTDYVVTAFLLVTARGANTLHALQYVQSEAQFLAEVDAMSDVHQH